MTEHNQHVCESAWHITTPFTSDDNKRPADAFDPDCRPRGGTYVVSTGELTPPIGWTTWPSTLAVDGDAVCPDCGCKDDDCSIDQRLLNA